MQNLIRKSPAPMFRPFPGILGMAAAAVLATSIARGADPYRSPFELAFSPDGKSLAVSDRTAGRLAIIDVEGGAMRVSKEVALRGQPTGIAWTADGKSVLVAEYDAGSVAEVDAAAGEVRRRLKVGLRPMGIAVAAKRGLLLAANTVTDDVSVIDLATGIERARPAVPREPFFIAISPDESLALIGNLLPAGSAADPQLSACISLLDLEKLAGAADIRLPAGSTSVREVAVSPDGRWGYAVHTLGRFNVPTTQLERGWVNTNALSIIDLAGKSHYATVLLDHPFEGATDPWGLALSRDGGTLWISLRGVHQVARVDLAGLHQRLGGSETGVATTIDGNGPGARDIWAEIRRAPERRALLADDLAALHAAGLIDKISIPGNGPRGIDLSPDGKRLAAAMYFSGGISFLDAESRRPAGSLPLGSEREPDIARRGEMLFHDATICFQKWMSCSTCHPDEGRNDGLRWDLMNDGIGTPQRTRSLLLSYRIRPTTSRGVRGGIEDSVPKGLVFFLRQPEPELVDPLLAYLKSLRPEPSPFLEGNKLSSRALRGKQIFEGKGQCTHCHDGELGTDLKAHDIGTGGEYPVNDRRFYTPKLVELYRTAPFLHDGRAATLLDVFTSQDPNKLHGKTAELNRDELDDLVEYLKSR